jgi:hypothetical protein
LKAGEIDLDKEFFKVLKGQFKEVDWALFETRVRQMVQELMEPLAGETSEHCRKVDTYRKE